MTIAPESLGDEGLQAKKSPRESQDFENGTNTGSCGVMASSWSRKRQEVQVRQVIRMFKLERDKPGRCAFQHTANDTLLRHLASQPSLMRTLFLVDLVDLRPSVVE